MAYEIYLPKNAEQREVVLSRIVDLGKRIRHIYEVNWWITHHYLQGAREFKNVNYQRGTVDVSYINEDGLLRFRYDDIVSKFQTQLGRLMQIDIAPSVTKRSVGLEDLRKASIAQVVLDSAFPINVLDRVKLSSLPPLLKYGLIGLCVVSNPDTEYIGIDVAMPWELLPIPAGPLEDKDVRGIARVRVVPLDWLKQFQFAPTEASRKWKGMNTYSVPVGQVPTDSGGTFRTYTETIETPKATDGIGSGLIASSKKDDNAKTMVDVAELAEIWLYREDGYLGSYEIMVGGKLWDSRSMEGKKKYVPTQVVTDIPTGGFYGRSYVSTLLHLNTELEYTIGRMLQNVQDLDAYGMLTLPTTLGIPTEIMRSSDGYKKIVYEPDYASPDLKPGNITPFNVGNMPVETIKVATSLADRIANQPAEIMQGGAPGRVDSQAALGFLYEVANTPLSGTAAALELAVSNCYKAALNEILETWSNDKTVEITLLDDSLAGIALDMNSGALNLTNNTVPHPDEVRVTIRSRLPKSAQQEKMELQEALKLGSIDMFEYRVEVRKRGLSLPVGNEAEWQNYRRAMLENLMMFNDGKEPRQVTVDSIDIPQVHLRVLQGFMARPEFFMASDAVRTAFKEHYQLHQEQMGIMPEGAPMPEDAAEEAKFQEELARFKQQNVGLGMTGEQSVRT